MVLSDTLPYILHKRASWEHEEAGKCQTVSWVCNEQQALLDVAFLTTVSYAMRAAYAVACRQPQFGFSVTVVSDGGEKEHREMFGVVLIGWWKCYGHDVAIFFPSLVKWKKSLSRWKRKRLRLDLIIRGWHFVLFSTPPSLFASIHALSHCRPPATGVLKPAFLNKRRRKKKAFYPPL